MYAARATKQRQNPQGECWSDFLARAEREAASTEGNQPDDVEQILEPHVDESEQEPALVTELDGNNIEQLSGIIHKTRMKAVIGKLESWRNVSWGDFLDRAERERSPIIERESSNGDQSTFQVDTNAQAVAKIQLSFATEIEGYNSKERTCICGRRTRVEEHRPCSEMPVLDYSAFEEIFAAQKELGKEKGSQDIAWRTESMDTVVEQSLLARYTEWVWERLDEGGSQQGSAFLRGLQQEPRLDFDEVRLEMLEVAGRHGKRPKDSEKLFKEMRSIARQNNPASVEDLHAVAIYPVHWGIPR